MTDTAAPPIAADLAFMAGGGETGRAMRATDWAATPWGMPGRWPQPLRTLVGVMLAADQPMFLAWGPQRLMLYNDRYATILADRHPGALGRPFFSVWHEVVADVMPLFERVFAGEPVHMPDIELQLDRPGLPREAHFAFSYTPVHDEHGTVVALFCPCVETTEQVLAERHRADAAARQRALLQQMPGFVGVVAGPDHVYEYVNDAYVEIAGGRALIGRSVREAFPELAGQGFYELLDQVYATGKPFTASAIPIHLAREEGERQIDLLYQPIRDEAGTVTGVFVAGHDVTERVRAEAELRASEARVRLLADAVPHMVWITAPDGTNEYFNRQWYDFTGVTPGADAEQVANTALHPAERRATIEAFKASLASGEPFEIEHRIRARNGQYRWFLARADAYRDPGTGAVARWYGASVDIHDRKEAERALRQSERRLRAVIAAAPVGLVFADVRGRITGGNVHMEEIVGHPVLPAPDVQVRDWIGVHADGRRVAAEDYPLAQVIAGADRAELELLYRRGDGRDAWVRFIAAAVRDGAGALRGAVLTALDIDRKRRAEVALHALNADLERQVIERTLARGRTWQLSPDLLSVIDWGSGAFEKVNPAWEATLGWSADELEASSHALYVHPDDAAATAAALGGARDGRPLIRFENRFRHKEGGWRWLSWVCVPEGDKLYASTRDVTADKAQADALSAAQEALRQSQKMEAVGQLTGGIAHDFNNMLAVVIGSLDLLDRRLDSADERTARYLDAAREGARRAALLTQRLLAFSRQQPLRPEPVAVDALLAGLAELIRGSVGSAIRLEVSAAPGTWRIHTDPNQLENVLLNLAVNARDAMPDGGSLTIAASNVSLAAGRPDAEPGLPPGDHVLIEVADSGTGMSADTVARAFDPFFTTKTVGKGTGLGLSQVYGFVKQSGGHVALRSTPGKGTTVRIHLPRFTGSVPLEAGAPTARDVAPGSGRGSLVLVVDDEPAVRRFSVDALVELGYRVLEADGAAAALRLLAAHDDVALLFTDVVMPEVNGRKLAQAAAVARPGLRVLFTTGYTRDAVVHDGVLDADVQLIGKPFTIEELGVKVRAVLDAASPA